MRQLIATGVLLLMAASACAQSVTITSLDVENVTVFPGSGTVRASVNMETNSFSSGRISALRSIGFFQVGNQWAYQVTGMQYPLVVAQLPKLTYTRGQWKLLAPGKLTNRVAGAPKRSARR